MSQILILTANPQGTSQLRLEQEVRDIEEGLHRAKNRDQFALKSMFAVRPRDIQRAMLDINPSIVHFSGHGTGDEGLVFEDEAGSAKLVDAEALAGLFELFAEQVECVVLNGCYSEVQAEAIAQHINYVIGMKQAIGDQAAIEFAVGFYDALGAGRSVEFAHKLGCAAIRLAGIPEQLYTKVANGPATSKTKVMRTWIKLGYGGATPKVMQRGRATIGYPIAAIKAGASPVGSNLTPTNLHLRHLRN